MHLQGDTRSPLQAPLRSDGPTGLRERSVLLTVCCGARKRERQEAPGSETCQCSQGPSLAPGTASLSPLSPPVLPPPYPYATRASAPPPLPLPLCASPCLLRCVGGASAGRQLLGAPLQRRLMCPPHSALPPPFTLTQYPPAPLRPLRRAPQGSRTAQLPALTPHAPPRSERDRRTQGIGVASDVTRNKPPWPGWR